MVSSCKPTQKELKWDKYVDNSIDNDLSCVPKYYRNHPRVTRTRLPIIKLSKSLALIKLGSLNFEYLF